MAIYRNIRMSFWTDSKVVDDFTPEDKYFYLYVLTNPHTNLAGCYEISIKQMSDETGYSKETIQKLVERLEKVHRVLIYKNKELLIVNWHEYNWITSAKFKKPLLAEIENIKDKEFKDYLLGVFNEDTVSIPYPKLDSDSGYGIDTTVTVTDTDICIPVSNKSNKSKRKNINDNLKVLDNILSNNTELSDTLNNLGLLDITKKWMTYKNERKDYLQETSIKTLVNKIIDSVNEYSVKAVISVINDSVSAGYVGIVWDKLKKAGSSGSAYIDAIKNRNNDIASWDLSDVAEQMGFE